MTYAYECELIETKNLEPIVLIKGEIGLFLYIYESFSDFIQNDMPCRILLKCLNYHNYLIRDFCKQLNFPITFEPISITEIAVFS